MNKKELKNHMKSLVLRFGEKVKCEWLDMDGDKWIPTKMEINVHFLSEVEKGYIRNIELIKNGVECILFERQRQITEEGWSPEHDDECSCGELADAAVCYATRSYWRHSVRNPIFYLLWPFDLKRWKPMKDTHQGKEYIDGRVRELSKAGALIAAEIDRLVRLRNK